MLLIEAEMNSLLVVGTEQQDERCRWLVQQKIGWLSALSVRGDDARVTDFFVNVDLI